MTTGEVIALIKAFGGGGGGSSGGGVLVVHLSNDGESWESDKTRTEILTAMSNGPVFIDLFGYLGLLKKDADYPEIYGFVLNVEADIGGGTLTRYYVEFAEDGTLSVEKIEFSLTSAS